MQADYTGSLYNTPLGRAATGTTPPSPSDTAPRRPFCLAGAIDTQVHVPSARLGTGCYSRPLCWATSCPPPAAVSHLAPVVDTNTSFTHTTRSELELS